MIFKRFIPNNIKKNIIYLMSSKKQFQNVKWRDKKKIIIALAANYGNLGDIAITYAQREFLKNNFKGYEIIEIPIDETYKKIKSLKNICTRDDIITIIGGGNFGDTYLDIEETRQLFIKKFPNNKIVCFPQTISFSNTKKGHRLLHKAIKIYGKHKNLVLFAREKKSYDIMSKSFKNNKVYLVPDIVLSLDKKNKEIKREKITICFRDDVENCISKDIKESIISNIKNNNNELVVERDTHIGNVRINLEEREKILEKIWMDFRESKLVLTDRLHGMIFCVITGTPCIFFQNSNGKIKATYDTWLKEYKNIAMADEDLDNQIQKMKKMIKSFDKDIMKDKYIKLIEVFNNK